jgi:uncharacterized protein (DUF427 family)
MAVDLRRLVNSALPDTRVQRIDKRVRGFSGDRLVVDSEHAVLVWEPRRYLPEYAVPAADVHAELVEDPAQDGETPDGLLPPHVPFTSHSAPGTPLTLRVGDRDLIGAGFRHDDPDLEGLVVVHSKALDAWWEEDEPVLGHPRDPMHRIECLPSARHVVVRCGDTVLADSTRPVLLLEPPLPVRYYLPREDVRLDLLQPSDTRTICPYKGVASYWSLPTDGVLVEDVAWTYPDALHDAAPVEDMVCFYPEKVDLTVS